MNGRGESDSRVVAGKSPNKVRNRAAEGMEPRRLAKRNSCERNMARTQSRSLSMSHALARVRDVARRKEVTKFTALYHHVYNVEHLRAAYAELKPKAAAGGDGGTWAGGRWVSRVWRTRSSRRWPRNCSKPFTNRGSNRSATGFGRGAARTMRWTR